MTKEITYTVKHPETADFTVTTDKGQMEARIIAEQELRSRGVPFELKNLEIHWSD
ncbi:MULTISPECIES: hypothetical protein [Mycobacteriaceae]|uniref:hypothetical protein n=1 Tax=Mycobacteriaceae TaxID=1762 RepID=UPI00092C6C74|nr:MULTISPECIES: hypothetical protein [Mycobacteriaceae]SIH15586.1 Uncharacterised protein [Mycobacteroides abscessus subsp. abscessus]